MDEQTNTPVAVENVPAAESAQEPAASVEQQTPPTPDATTTPETTPQKLDHKSLLKDPEFRKQILADEEFQRDYEHRVQSEAGRRAKAQADAYIAQQQRELAERQRLSDIERKKGMDEYDLGVQTKQELAEQEVQLAKQQRQLEIEQAQNFGTTLGTMTNLATRVNNLYNAKELTAEEWGMLQPQNFSGSAHPFDDYQDAVWSVIVEKKAQKKADELVKKRVPIEVEAIVQERLGEQREGAVKVPSLPNGNTARTFTRQDLANMSPEEYRKNREIIFDQMHRR